MLPHTRTVSNRTVSGIGQSCDYHIKRPVQSTFKTEHQVSQESMEEGQTRVTKQLTGTATPQPLQENPESVIIRHLQLAQALFFIIYP